MYDELIKGLREDMEWAESNEWETPIMLFDHLKQAADAIEELTNRNVGKWIPVTERLPEYDSVVLVTNGEDVGTGYRYVLGEIGFTGWAVPFADIEEDDVSHWMPLPEPPKEDAI
jgi:hypothetical protein